MAMLFDSGIFSVEGLAGEILPGTTLGWFQSATSTPLATYTDPSLTTPNANPVVVGADGRLPSIWLQEAPYKLVVTLPNGTPLTRDPIRNPASGNFPSFTELADDNGSDLIGFIQAGADAVPRTVQDKSRDVVSVKDFGAVGDGVTDDAGAFQAAIDAMEALGGGAVYIPNGVYVIGSSLTMKRFVTIEGAGIDAAVLLPTFAGNLFSINLTSLTPFPGFPDASVYWSKFTIDCRTQTGVTGISMVCCRFSGISEIKFKGCSTNIYVDRGRKHSIHTIYSEGTATLKVGGIVMTSTDDADYVFESNLYDIHFHNNYTTGTQPVMISIRRGALILVSQVSLNDGWQGNVTAAIGILLENDCQGCKVLSVIMAAVSTGIILQPGTGPAVAPSYCSFENVDMDQARNASLIIDTASLNNFTNCNFSASGVFPTITSVIVRNGAGSNIFVGCRISGYNGAGGTALDMSNCSGTLISDCSFYDCTRGVLFGTSCTTTSLNNSSFASVPTQILGMPGQVGNSIKANPGHKYTSNLAPTVPASTVSTTNNTAYAVTVYIVGGTVTVISVNGVFTGITTGAVRLEPGDTIAITYSVVPTWVWVPSWA